MMEVYGINAVLLGEAASFGEARRMQRAALPDDLKAAYAGYQDGGPIFYAHLLTDDLMTKYPQLATENIPAD
jgi:hypothetical protein